MYKMDPLVSLADVAIPLPTGMYAIDPLVQLKLQSATEAVCCRKSTSRGLDNYTHRASICTGESRAPAACDR